jgi:hypothetical protein
VGKEASKPLTLWIRDKRKIKYIFVVQSLKSYEMLPSKAFIAPCILLLFTDIRSPGFSKLFRNKSIELFSCIRDFDECDVGFGFCGK